jgi:hypothetical protein
LPGQHLFYLLPDLGKWKYPFDIFVVVSIKEEVIAVIEAAVQQ